MSDQFSSEKELIKEALDSVDSNNLRFYLKELTRDPHIAGQRRDEGVFLQLRNKFEFPTKIIFTNISTGIGVTAISYL